jgi:hypothetical protein
MSIPYNENLGLSTYRSNPNWYQDLETPSCKTKGQLIRALVELYSNVSNQPAERSVQFIRDTARLVLKVPIRAIAKPIIFEKNWKERERAKVNVKLTGYSFVQLVFVPAKFMVALSALATLTVSKNIAKGLLDTSEEWTIYLDGRASQLEALKEEGAKKTKSRLEFDQYRTWLYNIDPKLCHKRS